MIRFLLLGSSVAIGAGVLLGITLAYQLIPLTVLAVLAGLAGTFFVVRATPEPMPIQRASVTLGGPLTRPIEEEDLVEDAITAPEPETTSVPIPVSAQQVPVPIRTAVPDAA